MSKSDILDDLIEMGDEFAKSSTKSWGYRVEDIAAVMERAATEIRDLREKLDEAVGYRLATRAETRGDQDRV